MHCTLLKNVFFAATLVFVGQPIFADAADINFGTAAPANNMVVYWGADAYKSGYGLDAGFAYALNGDILSSGWVLSGNMGCLFLRQGLLTPFQHESAFRVCAHWIPMANKRLLYRDLSRR